MQRHGNIAPPDQLSNAPAWMPFDYDAQADDFLFAYLPKDVQRRLTFLDPRYMGGVPLSDPITADALEHIGDPPARPAHFIFHTAFCCSTLLARALDIPGVSMGLKEPAVLVSLAGAMSRAGETSEFKRALGVALDLLARPLSAGETQIVKPSNLTNVLAPSIMRVRPQTKAIVIYSSLEDLLRSTARKGPAGHAFSRELTAFLENFTPRSLLDSPLRPFTDFEHAAYAWLIQAQLLSTMARELGSERVRMLDCATLLASPTEALGEAGLLFELKTSPETWSSVAEGPVFREHAKQMGTPFSAHDRRAELEDVTTSSKAEIADTIDWALAVVRSAELDIDLAGALPATAST